jgi:hypothetical protein
MSISVTCTVCGFSGHAPDSANGRRVKCRKCGASILAALPEATPPAAPSPPGPEVLSEEKSEAAPPPAAPKPDQPATREVPGVELLPVEPWYYRFSQAAAALYALSAPVIAALFLLFLVLAYPERPTLIMGGAALALLGSLLSVAIAGAIVVFLDIGRDIREIRRRLDSSDEAGDQFTE